MRDRPKIGISTKILIISIILILSFFLSIGVGPVWIPPREIVMAFMGRDLGPNGRIILDIRLPRAVLGLVVGMALSSSGVVFQGMLRNPLADPYVLGISSGAAVGASIAFLAKIGFEFIPIFAFIGSIATVLLVYQMALEGGRLITERMLLSGIIMNSFLSALMLLFMSIAGEDLHQIVYWLMGDLGEVDRKVIMISSAYMLFGLLAIWSMGRDLNLISLGEEEAFHLGVDVEKVKRLLFASSSLAVGAAVSATGIIGFIGLVVPHMMRIIFGADNRILIPASAIAGSSLLLLSDIASRMVIAPAELPIGVVTAMIGAPFFAYLLRRSRR